MPADVERLPDGHKSYNGIKKEGRNLQRGSVTLSLHISQNKVCLQKSLFIGGS